MRSVASRHASSLGAEWPFVGRGQELAQVIEAAGSVGVLVVGDVGVGKSRLLHEAGGALLAQGVDVVHLVGVPAAGNMPLTPLLPVLCERADADDPARRIIAELYRRAAEALVVLVVDDAQLLDPASAAVIHQMAHTDMTKLIVAARTPDPLPDSLEQLRSDGHLSQLRLGPLDRQAAEELVRLSLDGPVDPASVHRLLELSQGYPLFLREMLQATIEAGLFYPDIAGRWRLANQPLEMAHLGTVVSSRIDRLDATERAALECVALAPDVSLEILEGLTSAAACRRIERRGFVRTRRSDGHQQVSLAHPVFGEAALSALSAASRRQHERRLGAALSTSDRPGDAARAAMLLLRGDAAPDTELIIRATREAANGIDAELHERLARAASDRTGVLDGTLHLAVALSRQRRWDEATPVYADALLRCDVEERLMVLAEWMRCSHSYSGDLSHTHELVDGIPDDIANDPALIEIILRFRLFVEPLVPIGDEITAALARTDIDASSRARLQVLRMMVLYSLAQCNAGLDVHDQIDHGALDPMWVARERLTATWTRAWGGGLDVALADVGRWVRATDHDESPDIRFYSLGGHAVVLFLAGRPADAVHCFRRANDLRASCREARADVHFLAEYALALTTLDEAITDEATALLDEVSAYSEIGQYFPTAIVALARSRLARPSDPAAGDDWLRQSITAARERHCVLHESAALFELVCLRRTEEAVDRLQELAAAADRSGFVAWWAQAALLDAARDGDGLDALAQVVADRGAPGLAHDLSVLANRHCFEADEHAIAYRAVRRCRRLRDMTPGRRSLLTVEPVAVLSARAREMCDAAVDGATDAEIAERFFVAERTVQGHLYRSYRKLGLHGRDELIELIGETRTDTPCDA